MAYINIVNDYIAVNDQGNALKYIDTALRHEPKNFNLLTTKGSILSVQHQYPEAIALLTEAVRVKHENISGYMYLAECYHTMHEDDKAVKVLDTALRYDPGNFVLLNNKGYSLQVMGKYNEAIACFNAALNINPDYTTAQINLRDCYKAIGDTTAIKK